MGIQAGGLASGLDTASIIDSLVTLQKAPITKIENRMTAVKVRVSALSTISSQLKSLDAALTTLQSSGTRASTISSKNTSFTATTTTGAVPGRFNVQVEQLATAAKARSALLSSETAPVNGSTLSFSIDGTTTDIEIEDGTPLNEVAEKLNGAGLPITAAVLFDGEKAVLSVSRTSTGHTVGSDPSTALSITETVTGSGGSSLGLAVTSEAKNTVAQIDGMRFERQSTRLVGAIPGVTIEATAEGSNETVVVAEDNAGTKDRLQKFVDAYNAVAKSLQGELNLKPETDRSKTLAGDTTLRLLQGQLQRTISTQAGGSNVGGLGLQTLADIGLKSNRDGTIAIDQGTLTKALERDGAGVDRLFAKTSAIASGVNDLVKNFTGTDGIISKKTTAYGQETTRLTDDKVRKEARLAVFREQLVRQFTAMESIVSSMNSTSSYLTNAFKAATAKE
ncbi:MAG TPA: flagellar filament capping protein FliD [Myxococcota bacterium]